MSGIPSKKAIPSDFYSPDLVRCREKLYGVGNNSTGGAASSKVSDLA